MVRKKLKIALVCPYDIYKMGGVQSLVFNLKEYYKNKGHYVKIITPLNIANNSQISDQDIIFVGRSTDFNSPLYTTVQISATVNFDRIQSVLDEQNFDVIHLHEPWVPFLSRQILTRSKSVNIGTFHAKIPESVVSRTLVKVVNPYLRSILTYLNGLTAVSWAAQEYLTSLTDHPIEIIPNCIKLSDFTSKVKIINKKRKTILYIGRLETRKGLKYLINAFDYLNVIRSNHNYELVIIGDGPLRDRLKDQVKILNLKNVKFLGSVTDQKKLDYLKEADVFCSPSIFGESFGIVLLEALASGVPIVASDNSGYSEILKNTGALSLVNVKDTKSFARHLDLFLSQEDLRKIYLDWSKQYIQQFDYNLIAKKYLDYYYDILQK